MIGEARGTGDTKDSYTLAVGWDEMNHLHWQLSSGPGLLHGRWFHNRRRSSTRVSETDNDGARPWRQNEERFRRTIVDDDEVGSV